MTAVPVDRFDPRRMTESHGFGAKNVARLTNAERAVATCLRCQGLLEQFEKRAGFFPPAVADIFRRRCGADRELFSQMLALQRQSLELRSIEPSNVVIFRAGVDEDDLASEISPVFGPQR